MQFSLLLLWLLPFVYALDCNVAGHAVSAKSYWVSTNRSLISTKACAARCVRDAKCRSFAIGNRSCRLFKRNVKTLITKVEGSPFTFFDRNCRIPKAATTTQKATTTTQSALPTCVATEGFANGGFDISGGWSYEQPGSSYIPNKQLGATGAYENSADGWVLLLNFYLEEEYRTTVRDTKDAAIVTSFESEVKMCPGVQYNTDFRVRQARGDMSCTLNISLGEKQIFELDDFSEDWTNSGSISVPVVKAGQKGVRQSSTSSDLYVKFRGTMTCIPGYKKKGESGHWHVRAFFDTFLLDSFTIEPVQN